MQWNSVVLPAPFGPISRRRSPVSMRVETPFRVLGYPGLAMICFGAAAAGGVWLVVSTFFHDSGDKKRRSP